MRISTRQFHDSATQRLVANNAEAARTQHQISLGKRLLSNADDPAAATRVLTLERNSAQRAQHIANVDHAEATLGREEAVLSRVGDIYQRIRELTVQAGGIALQASDRRLLGAEVISLRGELVQLANSRDAEGQYMFAGSASTQPPFQDGRWVGVTDQREINVAADLRIPVSDSGFAVFEDVPLVSPRFAIAPHPANSSSVTDTLVASGVTDPEALAEAHPGQFVVTFSDTGFTVTRADDGRAVAGLVDAPFSIGAPFEFAGMSMTVVSKPAPGDRFAVNTTDRQSVFTSIDTLAAGLRSDTLDDAAVAALVADGIDNLDAALETVIDVRTQVGSRLSTLEHTREVHLDVELAERSLISDLSDLDYAEAVSRLSFQSFLLEASQQSFVRLAGLSLFQRL